MRVGGFFGSALAVAAMAAGMSVAPVGTAAAKDVGTYGGDGGSSFRSPCRPGEGLAGLRIRSGTALDAVAALCVKLNFRRTDWNGEPYTPTQLWGGGGGGSQSVKCNEGDIVRRLRVSAGPWGDIPVVKHIAIECYDLSNMDYHYRVVQKNPQGTLDGSRWKDCPDGYIGSGVYGRAGNLVDRLGLSCEKRRRR